ncbi:MAG: gamma-glutamyl-gamma-aminobutyrate hydrolase family protein [Planctomycetota bacterium]
MERPLIGIEVDLEHAPSGRRYAKCYESYFDAVSEAGGAPLLVPPAPAAALARQLASIDALVFPGGDDFHASAWGEEQRPCARFVASDERRLDAGRALLEGALAARLPYLGVCYGMQLLALLHGGALVQDVPDEVPRCLDHRASHEVEVAPGTLLARLAGAGRGEVNSRHHQAVRVPGAGLRVSARAPDGVVEAIEGEEQGRFLLGVQWHPEDIPGPLGRGLFAALVEAARARLLTRCRPGGR